MCDIIRRKALLAARSQRAHGDRDIVLEDRLLTGSRLICTVQQARRRANASCRSRCSPWFREEVMKKLSLWPLAAALAVASCDPMRPASPPPAPLIRIDVAGADVASHCLLTVQEGGVLRSGWIPKRMLPAPLKEAVRAGLRTSWTLRTTPVATPSGSTAALTCITRKGSGRSTAISRAANENPRWLRPFLQAVRFEGSVESASALSDAVYQRFFPRSIERGQAQVLLGPASLGIGRIGSVTIFGIPDFGWNILNSFSAVGEGGFVEWNWPSGGPVCDDQVGLFLALDEQAELVDRYATVAAEMAEEIGQNECLVSMASQFKYCVDAFIPDEWAWIFAGDNRDHLPDVDPSKSRVQIFINPDAGPGQRCQVRISATTMRTPNGVISRKDSAGTFDPSRDLSCEFEGANFVVRGSFRNNFCTSSLLPLCPAITVELRLSPSASNATGWQSQGLNDPERFPSFTVKSAVNGHWSIVQQYDATARNFMTQMLELSGALRALRRLPPSCNVE